MQSSYKLLKTLYFLGAETHCFQDSEESNYLPNLLFTFFPIGPGVKGELYQSLFLA